MAAPGKKKLLALDTNLLFDLAAGKDFAHTFREVYQERGYALVVPPTAIQELAYCALEKQCAETPLAGIPALVTSDADLLDIDETKLALEFESADLPLVQICHPKRLLKAMAPKR